MRKYAWRGLIIFVILEITLRIIVDPLYYYSADAYTPDKTGYNLKRLYFPEKTDKIDFLFVGESQMAAAIDVNEIAKRYKSCVAINAGKGYSTGAVHYWALKKLIPDNPDIIKNSKIIIDVNTGMKYLNRFEKEEFRIYEGYSHFLLPYLNNRLLYNFVRYSDSKPVAKIKLVLLYSSSCYRTLPFISSKLHELVSRKINTNTLAATGGIRTDKSSIEKARQLLIETVRINLEKQNQQIPITDQDIDNSMLSKINDLIVSGGGKLVLLDMPLHSFQRAEYETSLSTKNRETLTIWAKKRNISIINVDNFRYSDSDFPDYWHLASNRSEEFTYEFLNKLELLK